MIEKFRKIQHSWAIKVLLILTALSFMSLFGVSGYVNSAGSNKTIIEVDGTKIGLNEINALFNRDIQMATTMFGQELNLSPETKSAILVGVVNQEAAKLIIEKTAQNNGIDLSEELLKGFIQTQPQFMGEDGKFNFNLFKRFLAMTYQTEETYINSVDLDIKKQLLVNQVVENIAFPKAYDKYLSQAASIKKVIEYIKIEPTTLKVDRKISDEELEQYYQDFASEFMAPETRDVKYIFIKANDDYEANATLMDEIEDTIGGGASLEEVAKQYNTKVEIATKVDEEGKAKTSGNGFLEAVGDMADSIFSYNEGEISNVIETEKKGFAVVEVVKIYPEYQKDIKDVKNDIIKIWTADEQLAIAQEISQDVVNDINVGDDLTDISKRFSLNLKKTAPLSKGEAFEGLSPEQALRVYNQAPNSIKVVETKDAKIMAVVKSVIKAEKPNEQTLQGLKSGIGLEAGQNLTNSYGKDLDVKIHFNKL